MLEELSTRSRTVGVTSFVSTVRSLQPPPMPPVLFRSPPTVKPAPVPSEPPRMGCAPVDVVEPVLEVAPFPPLSTPVPVFEALQATSKHTPVPKIDDHALAFMPGKLAEASDLASDQASAGTLLSGYATRNPA